MRDDHYLPIPLLFQKTIINLYGEKGQVWLENLPSIIDHLSHRHHLQNLTVVNNLSYNLVLKGWQDKTPIVLKIGLDKKALHQEAAALKAFAGNGAISLLTAEDGLLILEQAIPGTSLKSFFPQNDRDAIEIACTTMQKLYQAKVGDKNFPHISDWLRLLYTYNADGDNQFLQAHQQRASRLTDKLLSSIQQTMLLHGDLHHDNILNYQGKWLAIDPKGVAGEPAYEIAAFIRNPIPQLYAHPNFEKFIKERILLFSQLLEIPPQRIQEWCYVQSILCWIWSLQDKGNPAPYQQFANFCAQLIRVSS
ncbi:MAG: aminoglycoside phosphotransferase family protein [Candidatus Paracaedibacteraceae bacterium]|nr:aminoglycoside phosphotransferase family protein [Candidatus Paracaedibacteraceae bacterium]